MTEVTDFQVWILLGVPLVGFLALLVWIIGSWVVEYREYRQIQRKENEFK